MPASHIVMCHKKEDVEQAKKLIKEQGGDIVEEYTIIPGFAVTLPSDSVSTLSNHPIIRSVENNGEMTTQ